MLRDLASKQGVLTAMIEAGGNFSAAMLEAGLIDEAVIYFAPMLCGGPTLALAGEGFPEGLKLEEISYAKVGPDVRMSGIIAKK
jgi:diaminohydroxyphosphoribosylaminopyrimidine deaminase/5-amino-6-(5-phosphoribosylamino)uracil reductase